MCKPAQAEAQASPAVLAWLTVKTPLIKYTSGQLLLPKQSVQQSITYFNTTELKFLSMSLFKNFFPYDLLTSGPDALLCFGSMLAEVMQYGAIMLLNHHKTRSA